MRVLSVREKCAQDQLQKMNHRKNCIGVVKPIQKRKPYPKPTVSRALMFSRLKAEVKDTFFKEKVFEMHGTNREQSPRRERRQRMIALARKTMKMLREQGAQNVA